MPLNWRTSTLSRRARADPPATGRAQGGVAPWTWASWSRTCRRRSTSTTRWKGNRLPGVSSRWPAPSHAPSAPRSPGARVATSWSARAGRPAPSPSFSRGGDDGTPRRGRRWRGADHLGDRGAPAGQPRCPGTANPARPEVRVRPVCDQCYACTELCPRRLLGHAIEPHKLMRRAGKVLSAPGEEDHIALYCCECGACSLVACPVRITPAG